MIDDALLGDRGQILPSRALVTRLRVWLCLRLIAFNPHVWAAFQEAYLWPHCVDCGARLPERSEHRRWIGPGISEAVCTKCLGGGRGLFRLLRGGRAPRLSVGEIYALERVDALEAAFRALLPDGATPAAGGHLEALRGLLRERAEARVRG